LRKEFNKVLLLEKNSKNKRPSVDGTKGVGSSKAMNRLSAVVEIFTQMYFGKSMDNNNF